jgi:hypothetical protein
MGGCFGKAGTLRASVESGARLRIGYAHGIRIAIAVAVAIAALARSCVLALLPLFAFPEERPGAPRGDDDEDDGCADDADERARSVSA